MSVTEYSAVRARVSFRAILRELLSARELIWRLCKRDLVAGYKQSMFGFLWALVPPLVVVATFSFLTTSRVLNVADTALPYPVYVLLGLTVWGVFATTLQNVTGSLTRSANLIQKMRFPREALVLAATGQSLVDAAIRAALVAVMAVLYGVRIDGSVVWVPFALIPLVLLTIGIGCVLAVLNALVRDVGNALTLFLQFAMFLTPVVYPRPTQWPHELLNYLNPVSPFVIAAQDLVTVGTLTMPGAWIGASVFGGVAFVAGLYVFRTSQPLIAERL